MAGSVLQVQSDPTLLADIRRYGKFDPTGCYQCGSCTLSCDLVGDSVTFPRRSIRYALLGLRQPLVESLDPWVCHDCGDCSVACPRQSEPRISMQTLRRFLCVQYDWTGIASKLLKSKAWYLGSLFSVASMVLFLIVAYHLWYVGMVAKDFATTALGLEHMFPIITYYTLTVILVPLLLLFSRVFRIWRLTMGGERQARPPLSLYLREAWVYVYQSVSDPLMRKCPEKGRWLGHWVLALGVVMMLTVKVFALQWFQTDNLYRLYHPQRWLGYVATALILYGLANIFAGRLRAKKEIYKRVVLSGSHFSYPAGVDRAKRARSAHLPVCRFCPYLSLPIRPAHHHRNADAAGRDVLWKVVAHGLPAAGTVFPGRQGESRAAGARGGGRSPCALRSPQ